MVSTAIFREPEMETNFFFKKKIKTIKMEFKVELKLIHRDIFVFSTVWNIKAEETSIKCKGTKKLI